MKNKILFISAICLSLGLISCGNVTSKPDSGKEDIPGQNDDENKGDSGTTPDTKPDGGETTPGGGETTKPDEGTTPDSGETTPGGGESTNPDQGTTPGEGETTKPDEGETDKNPDVQVGEYTRINSDDLSITYQSIAEAGESEGMLPNKGTSNVLVVPINFSDLKHEYTFSSSNVNILDAAFNGTKADGSNDYWESVSSFYKKSSYGKVNLNFEIADPYTPRLTSKEFIEAEIGDDCEGTFSLIQEIYGKVTLNNKVVNFKDNKYDSNNDGYVDAVWFIYNSKDASNEENFWPYVFWYYPELQFQNINISAFANCSLSFLFGDDYYGRDAHTLIHETGHLFGLDDYYTYDKKRGNYITGAIGELDMMDANIGDHNAFSKAALGWMDLIVPTKSGLFKLKPSWKDGEAIVLGNPLTFNGSAFSEYLILEYYQPYGLNELDSTTKYMDSYPLMYSKPGLRVYHVDARLVEYKINNRGEIVNSHYANIVNGNLKTLSDNNVIYQVGHSNTRSRNYNYVEEDLIAVIPQDGRVIYGTTKSATNKCLFTTGDRFLALAYGNFFNDYKFNEGSKIPYDFTVNEINENELTLEINF